MAKINLTRKSQAEQIRIIKDYLIRRSMHNNQGAISLLQIIGRFKHRGLRSDKAKFDHFMKLVRIIKSDFKEEKPHIEITL